MKIRGRGLIDLAGSLLLRPIADKLRERVQRRPSGAAPSKSSQQSRAVQSAPEQSQARGGSEKTGRASQPKSEQREAPRASAQQEAPRAAAQNDNDRPRARAGADHAPDVADERTMRRIAEQQNGGLSSQESAERYARGENPGGLHHKAVRHDGPEHQRPELEEPQERKQTSPGGEKHIAVNRRGS